MIWEATKVASCVHHPSQFVLNPEEDGRVAHRPGNLRFFPKHILQSLMPTWLHFRVSKPYYIVSGYIQDLRKQFSCIISRIQFPSRCSELETKLREATFHIQLANIKAHALMTLLIMHGNMRNRQPNKYSHQKIFRII